MRRGADETYPNKGNTFAAVYRDMFLQIVRDYAGLPDARLLKAHEIRFFYDGLRDELKHHTKPR